MSVTLRLYQQRLDDDISMHWAAGHRVVMAVAPTGSGKTVLFSEKLRKHNGSCCAIAHRRELVGQMSLALARNGVRHRVIGPDKTVKACQRLQIRKLGRHFVDPNARCAAASVDTLINMNPADPWLGQVTLWIGDEGHHFLKVNKWGKAVALFTNPACRGLLVTATPTRADGRGLGADNDGLAHALVEAPGLRELIHMGYLTDYRIFTQPSDVDYSSVPVGPSGELVHAKLCEAVHASGTFVGDVVKSYQKHAAGKLGVTFAVDVESASEIAAAFRAAGVSAECVHAGTPDDLRADILARFERREVMQLVNVDLFGEGFDLPAIECVSLARKTESFSLFAQQCGRALRPMEGKQHAIIIDHVGNVFRHAVMRMDPWLGRPVIDLCYRIWSLDRKGSRGGQTPADTMPVRYCLGKDGIRMLAPGVRTDYADRSVEALVLSGMAARTGAVCGLPFERFRRKCPFCDEPIPEPAGRTSPEQVEGDLGELDPATLAELFAKIGGVQTARIPGHLDGPARIAAQRNIDGRREAQAAIQNALAWYGGWLAARGIGDQGEQWREFWQTFGADVATIQALPARGMWEWYGKIGAKLSEYGIDVSVNAGL
jgi:superfamily II DNA or RNA helicase